MTRNLFVAAVLSAAAFASSTCAWAGQAPAAASAPDIPVSHHDRFYTSDQFSNTVSVPPTTSCSASFAWESRYRRT